MRHGETLLNVEKRYQGSRNDSPLTDRGQEQAREMGRVLDQVLSANENFRFLSSPLPRARHTMELLLSALSLPHSYQTDESLKEIDLGDWSGMTEQEVRQTDGERQKARESDKWNIPVPGGESYAMVAQRAEHWFNSLASPSIVVSHGGFVRILRGIYDSLSWQQISTLDEPHGCIFRFEEGTVSRIETTATIKGSRD